jgi:hypothetical protein
MCRGLTWWVLGARVPYSGNGCHGAGPEMLAWQGAKRNRMACRNTNRHQ